MKKFLSSLLIGAFVFGLGAADVQVANAVSPSKISAYTQKRPEPPKNNQREQTRTLPRTGKTQLPAHMQQKSEPPKNHLREQTVMPPHAVKVQKSH